MIGKADRILAASRAPAPHNDSSHTHSHAHPAAAAPGHAEFFSLSRHSKSSPMLLPLSPAPPPASATDSADEACPVAGDGPHPAPSRGVPPLRLAALRSQDPSGPAGAGTAHALTQRSSPRAAAAAAAAASGSMSDRGPTPSSQGAAAAALAASNTARATVGWSGGGDGLRGGSMSYSDAGGEERGAGRVDRRAKIEELRGRVKSVWEALQVTVDSFLHFEASFTV